MVECCYAVYDVVSTDFHGPKFLHENCVYFVQDFMLVVSHYVV